MAIPVVPQDHHGHAIEINPAGELRVVQGDYDLTSFNAMIVDDQVYNYYLPKIGFRFVITGILAFADKDVSDASATVIEVYEADAEDSSTVGKVILTFGMGRLTPLPFPTVRILVNEGVYINGRTNDGGIHLNLMGHYLRAFETELGAT